MKESEYMERALKLAKAGNTSPNPRVGCVIVKDSKIISEGFHKKAGLPHAEIEALKKLGKDQAIGATVYVTLEPCCHQGRTPPCTDALIKANVGKVVAAMKDPNPLVSGKGIKLLEDAGIETDVGLLSDESRSLNREYIHFMETGTPYVILKTAMTLDGKIASKKGDSKWITGNESRELVHKMRGAVDAILVGIGTVVKDDPELTCRYDGGKDPVRVIVDSHLEISCKARVLKDKNVIIACTKEHNVEKKMELDVLGAQIFVVSTKNGFVDLSDLCRVLGETGVSTLLIEGGGEINGSAIESGIVNEIRFFLAPKIIGGRDAKTIVEGSGIELMADALKIKDLKVEKSGDDYLFTGHLK